MRCAGERRWGRRSPAVLQVQTFRAAWPSMRSLAFAKPFLVFGSVAQHSSHPRLTRRGSTLPRVKDRSPWLLAQRLLVSRSRSRLALPWLNIRSSATAKSNNIPSLPLNCQPARKLGLPRMVSCRAGRWLFIVQDRPRSSIPSVLPSDQARSLAHERTM
jgi:hypothetical protein